MPLHSSSVTGNHYRQREEATGLEIAHGPAGRAAYFRWKAVIDIAIACVLLVPASVAIAILVLLVRVSSRGPGIYQQVRVGKDGRPFMMYKIRTMRIDAEVASGPVWTRPNDRRVTFVGRILRKLHLDELPQIFNVFRGEMSFVGPRPERPEFVRVLSDAVPHYADRLLVHPGITGLAQLNLPPDTDLRSVHRKLAFDLDYIRHGNLWLDARLLFCTAFRLFQVHEDLLNRILRLQRPELLAAIETSVKGCLRSEEATPETILLQAARVSSSNGKPHENIHPSRQVQGGQHIRGSSLEVETGQEERIASVTLRHASK